MAPQREQLITVSGTSEQKTVSRTWNRYGGLLQHLSDEKGVEIACAIAVLCVEGSGKGFEQNNGGRMIIRFENHKFWKFWGRDHPQVFSQHFRYDPSRVWTKHKWRKAVDGAWQGFHGNQAKEWQVFDFARRLGPAPSMMSISMGAPQVMGFHFERLGYHSVAEMFDSLASDMSAQIKSLFDFLSEPMLQKLQHRDFVGFAEAYNGSGQKDKYGQWIASHYRAFKQVRG